ncbi:MAG TPA: vanadium-dependent haloperoxidase [Flavisolibacter sp.]|nr:vanadium-dependent haloperoxidase [Flavisolibacter sp.]
MFKALKPFSAIFLTLVIFAASCSKSSTPTSSVSVQSNQVVLDWNETAYTAFGGPAYQHSLVASRINAMMHLAMHDALNAIETKYARYAFNGIDESADPIAAAAAAAHAVLVSEMPVRQPFLDSALVKSLQNVKDGEARDRGLDLGRQAAQAVLAKRQNDGSVGDPFGKLPPTTEPGAYQTVPPFDIVFAPHWEDVKPFSIEKKDQFRSAPQPALNSAAYTEAFNEVKEKGRSGSTSRSAEQSAYAKFWYEFSEAGWNRIARTVAVTKRLNLLETARLFALVDMAIADAYIAGWDAKFHYKFWRPYTAIRNAASDGNENTTPDSSWEPAEPTPPVQDYPSTHSALGNAAATVLARLLGDKTSFTFSSPTAGPTGSARSFTSFSQAADENADSRVMAGIHFRFSCVAGQELGNKIGNWTVDNRLKALQ